MHMVVALKLLIEFFDLIRIESSVLKNNINKYVLKPQEVSKSGGRRPISSKTRTNQAMMTYPGDKIVVISPTLHVCQSSKTCKGQKNFELPFFFSFFSSIFRWAPDRP